MPNSAKPQHLGSFRPSPDEELVEVRGFNRKRTRDGRLSMDPSEAVALFDQAVSAFDSGSLKDACTPINTLRLYGISVRLTPRPGYKSPKVDDRTG